MTPASNTPVPPAAEPFWRKSAFWSALGVLGMVLGATCPLWPTPAQVVCVGVSTVLKHVGNEGSRTMAAAAADAGT